MVTPRAAISRYRHAWVAEQMGVSHTLLSLLLAGKRNWLPKHREAFAKAVGLSEAAIDFAQNLAKTARDDDHFGESCADQRGEWALTERDAADETPDAAQEV